MHTKTPITEISQAIEHLSSNFTIVGKPVDLRLLKEYDGENNVFNRLSDLHKTIYENNERIIVIQGHEDVYSYQEDQASDSIIFLQKSLQKIDISNFFVVVISPNPDLQQELEWVQKTHSSDDCVIGHLRIDAPYQKTSPDEETFCVIPWMHLYVNPLCQILPCCQSDDKKPWGNIVEQNIDQIINSDRAKKMRLNMLSNRKCAECQTCYNFEKNKIESMRMRHNKKWKHLMPSLLEKTNADGSIDDFEFKYLDLRLNNICNLKCRTCSGAFSSQLAQEEKQIFSNTENFDRIPTKDQRTKVLEKVIEYIDSAEKIYFAGGEPLIMSEHYEILDRLVELGKFDMEIYYNTNFTTLDFKGKNVLDYWKKFNNIKIGASIDGYGEVFEYVRHGAKFDQIETNLELLKKHCPDVNFTVFSTISFLSAESVMELQKVWHESGKVDINKFFLNSIIGGDHFSLQILSNAHKNRLTDLIDLHCEWLSTIGAWNLKDSWQVQKKLMWSADKNYVYPEFLKVNRARDIARQTNFESVYPHFHDMV